MAFPFGKTACLVYLFGAAEPSPWPDEIGSWLAVREPVCAPHQGEMSMSERIWDKFLTERDKAVFAAGGFGARAGFGKRPALLVIDVNWAFCGERPEPILESIKRWRTSCGEESWVALEYIKSLIEAARAKGLPVIYTPGHLHYRGAASGQLGCR